MSLLTTTRANAAGRVQGFVERARRRYVARGCESGDTGELVLCPNRRPYRRFVITNIIEKLVSQNDLYRRKFVRKLDAEVRVIPLQPGNAYFFWGYRTYHATFPCADDALRVTLILHYGNVHGRNIALTAAQSLSRGIRGLGRKLYALPKR